ncbi:MAG: T9SS type A sorting domain-containing protein [Bacteroidales bacterium]|jgi:predicted esterase
MKTTLLIVVPGLFLLHVTALCQKDPYPASELNGMDYISALKETLEDLSETSTNSFFSLHCQSMINVIEAKSPLLRQDSSLLKDTYNAFNNLGGPSNPGEWSTYLKRERPMIISWISPTDGEVSFSWFKLPLNWDPDKAYPLYVELHGLWPVASNSIEYMTYPYLNDPSSGMAFSDGYQLAPWGRGNYWYQGISETDIRECMDVLEELVRIDPARKYLCGHSMGGYGTWHIALGSPDTWAALGIHAGALQYGYPEEINAQSTEVLSEVPVYFVCGTSDGLLSINEAAYQWLADAGNNDIFFVTFPGGHEYLEENVLNMYLWMKNFENDRLVPVEDHSFAGVRPHMRIWPNPFSGNVEIRFYSPLQGTVQLAVYDQLGQVVEVLVKGKFPAGDHTLQWDPGNLAEGIYYGRLRTSEGNSVIRMVYHR